MLCHACHVHVRRDFPYCLHCGTLRKHAKVTAFGAPQLTAVDDATVFYPIQGARTSIGREPSNQINLDDPSVSRFHAVITREPGGFTCEDLDSLNGTSVAGKVMHGSSVLLRDGDAVNFGDLMFRFEQPRSIAIGSKTVVVGTQHTLLQSDNKDAETATEPLSARPRRRSGWALKQIPDTKGVEKWVLRNTRSGQYLEMSARDRFIWDQIDGEATVRDILFAYVQAYGELALPRIERALQSFESIGLVRGLSTDPATKDVGFFRRVGHALLTGLLRLEVSIKGIDGAVGWLYRAGAWRFFTRTGVVLLWALTVAGLVEFDKARHHQRLFAIGGAGVWGAVVIAAGYLIALMAHESAHALAVKSYGRSVTRGGFMLMMGMPFAFVDTSDMWLGTRWSRVVVTMSGPLSTAGLAGIFAITAAEVPNAVVAGMAFQLAFGLYMNTLYNCNPLMPLDGYQALADSLRLPKLREQAMAYASHGLWHDVKARKRPRVRELGLLLYGVAAIVCSYLFLLLGIRSWHGRLGSVIDRHFKPPFNTLFIVAVIALVMFPVWYRYVRKLNVALRRRRERDKPVADPSAEGSGALA